MKLSDKLIEFRKEKGWSQEEFAERLDVSRQAVSRWENETALPDAQNILRISRLFNVSVDYLLNDDYEIAENVSADSVTAEAPKVKSKKRKYPYVIAAVCGTVLVASSFAIGFFVGKGIPKEETHSHESFSCVRENEMAPTCSAEGSYDEVVYCTGCEDELLRTVRTVGRLAHSPSASTVENELAPTCTARGSYDEVIYCSACHGEMLRTRKVVNMTEHRYSDKRCISCGKAQPSEGLLFMSDGNGTCYVAVGDCTDENVVIPEYSPDGDKVVGIKAYAFQGVTHLKSIEIPETVTDIRENAFEDCVNLESVKLPSRITRIYAATFKGCESLKDLTIPSGVTYIGDYAFANCYGFESIVIPSSVNKIGKFAFLNFSRCEGSITFEMNRAWGLYDESGMMIKVIDLRSSVYQPVQALAFVFTEYDWIV